MMADIEAEQNLTGFGVLLIYSCIHLMKFNELNFRVRFKVVMQVLFSGFFLVSINRVKVVFCSS